MLVDEITTSVQGGKGGAGFVSFTRRKYQPFGGPDGGDGGRGGDVVLVGSKGADSLIHFRNIKRVAVDGIDGARALKTGMEGPPLDLPVPLGTTVYDARNGVEIGTLIASGQRMIVAHGGKGGRGNPHFKSSTNRAPKAAEPGRPGAVRDLLLRYRIYSDTVLLEPAGGGDSKLLPLMLDREEAEIDFELYERKPRWVRVEHNFIRYDPVYLPFVSRMNSAECPLLPHACWARQIFINLIEFENGAEELLDSLVLQLQQLEFPRLEQLMVATGPGVGQPEYSALITEGVTPGFVSGTREQIYHSFLEGLIGDPIN